MVDLITLRDSVQNEIIVIRKEANWRAIPKTGGAHYGQKLSDADRLYRTLNKIIAQAKR